MSAVEFGDLREPWSIDRRKQARWMHVLVRDVNALPESWRAELAAWLAERGVTQPVPSLLVTRDSDGGDWRVHVRGGPVETAFEALPVWLRQETVAPAKPVKARKAASGGE